MHHAHPPFELGLGLPAVAESAPGNLGTDDLFAQGARAAGHGYGTGAHQLNHTVMLQKPQQGVDLAFGTGGLNGQRFRIHVHHAHAD